MVSTNIRVIPELRQLEMGISTSLYFPPMGTAGFERLAVNGYSLVPAPPPNITDNICLLIILVFQFLKFLFVVQITNSALNMFLF
jgi:hypothetical protein